MNRFIPSFLKQFDAWLLLRFPRVWATRITIFAFFSVIVCNLILWLFAYLNKVGIEKLPDEKTLEMTVMLFTLLSILGVFYWFSQFKAKLKTFTYFESLLSLLMCLGVVASLMVNSQIFRATTIQRIGKLIPIEQSNKDLLLLKILETCASDQFEKIDSIENIKLYDTEIKQSTLEKIISVSNEINEIEIISDSLVNTLGRDLVTNELLQQVLKDKNFSEETKALYLQGKNSNLYEIKFNAFSTFIKNDLKKRYSSETNTDMAYKLREIYNAQNQKWNGLFFTKYFGYYSSGYSDSVQFIDSEQNSLKLTQERVDILKKNIESVRLLKYSFWDFRNENIIVVLFLTFAVFLFFNSAWRDFIITIISFVIAFVIYALGMEFSGTNFSNDAVFSTAVLFTLIYLIMAILFWLKIDWAIKNKRVFQIIFLNAIPVCYFAMISVVGNFSRSYYESELADTISYTYGTILFYSLFAPIFITLYHRLSGMPKYK